MSPLPDTEPPRDCPLCPRLVAFREALRVEHPDWWNAPVPSFGDPEARIAIVGLARASMVPIVRGGHSPAISRACCSTRPWPNLG
jgi:hypothetical protein